MIFETLDIMEGVDGMLELDFIVVDGTSAKKNQLIGNLFSTNVASTKF